MIIKQVRITNDDLRLNPTVLYLFGDNDERRGYGSLARVCRGEPNAIGIRTKKKPTLHADAFYTDDEFEDNVAKIDADLKPVWDHMVKGGVIVIPANGLGTGPAQMRLRCPRTFQYLSDLMNR